MVKTNWNEATFKGNRLSCLGNHLPGLGTRGGPAYSAYPGYAASIPFSWTGAYLGYNLGAGWNTQRTSSSFTGSWNTTNIGFVGGLQGGYNYQIKSFVIGVEVDADYVSESRPISSAPGPANIARPMGQWNRAASVGVLLSYTFDNLLIFGKFGYGWVT